MIKNMKIKKSLILGFGVTIVVSLAIIIAAIVLMTIQKNQYMDIIDKYVGANDIVSECRIDYNIAARGLRDAVLGGDLSNLDTATQKVNDLSQRLNDLDATYPLSDKTELNAFVNTVKDWEAEAQNIVSVARRNTAESRTEAAGMIAASCSPKLKEAAQQAPERAGPDHRHPGAHL